MEEIIQYAPVASLLIQLVLIPIYQKVSALNEKFHGIDKRVTVIEAQCKTRTCETP